MPSTYTAAGRQNLLATSADEPLLELIEITHPGLTVPARFVNDTQDIYFEQNQYFATAFQLIPPDSKDQQAPQAKLTVDNIGQELTQWLESSNGGKGARCRMVYGLRSACVPVTVGGVAIQNMSYAEFDMTLDLTGMAITPLDVTGSLGFKNTMMQSAVAVRFDPKTAPGLY